MSIKTYIKLYNLVWSGLSGIILTVGLIGLLVMNFIPFFLTIIFDPTFILCDHVVSGLAILVTSVVGWHATNATPEKAKWFLLTHIICLLGLIAVSGYVAFTLIKSHKGISVMSVVGGITNKNTLYDPVGLLDIILGGYTFVAVYFGKYIGAALLVLFFIPKVVTCLLSIWLTILLFRTPIYVFA